MEYTPEMIPFRQWCQKNGIGATKGYELANQGALKLVKLGRKSYVTLQESQRFISSLPQYEQNKAGV